MELLAIHNSLGFYLVRYGSPLHGYQELGVRRKSGAYRGGDIGGPLIGSFGARNELHTMKSENLCRGQTEKTTIYTNPSINKGTHETSYTHAEKTDRRGSKV